MTGLYQFISIYCNYFFLVLGQLTVVSIGRLTAFYVVFVPLEYIPSEPPHSA